MGWLRTWATFFTLRLATLTVGYLLFRGAPLALGEPGREALRQGMVRRAAIMRDEFPSGLQQDWPCASTGRGSDEPGTAAAVDGTLGTDGGIGTLHEFLEAWACGWDGKHYAWLAHFGYRPAVRTVVELSAPEPLGVKLGLVADTDETKNLLHAARAALRLRCNETPASAAAAVLVTHFRRSGAAPDVPLQAELSGVVGVGDALVAVDGRRIANVSSLEQVAQLFEGRPIVLTFEPSYERWFEGRAAFLPLFPLGFLRPILRAARAAGLDWDAVHACLTAACAAASSLGLLLAHRTRSLVFPEPAAVGTDSDVASAVPPSWARCLHASDWLLMAWPSAFFLSAPYSEAVFMPLSAAWLFLLQTDRRWAAAAVGVALPLTRGVGAFAVIPALVYSVGPVLAELRRPRQTLRSAVRLFGLGAVAVAPAAGYALHAFTMGLLTGDFASSHRAQSHFVAKFSAANLLRPAHLARIFFVEGDGYAWHEPTNSVLDRASFVLAVALLLGTFKRLPKHIWAFSLVTLLVPPLCGSMMSYVRFFVTSAYPLLWPFAVWREEPHGQEHKGSAGGKEGGVVLIPNRLFTPVVVGLCSVQVALIWRFCTMEWAG
mmetsp:Transcript_77182/g.221821  ORF Transcript_77182/g.221821 Transcript_77182/m.221821 type:complete len:603 (-) Transcript_77182:1660-3468(-)